MSNPTSPRIAWVLDHGLVGSTYRLKGWVRTRRGSKNVSFVALTDGSCAKPIQVVVPAEMPGYDEVLPSITTGCSVMVDGELVESPGKGQRVELKATSVTLVGAADGESYPLQKKGHTMEFMRSIARARRGGFARGRMLGNSRIEGCNNIPGSSRSNPVASLR